MSRLRPLLPILPFLVVALWLATRFRWVLGLFLIGHALVHAMYFFPEPGQEERAMEWPFRLDQSWLLTGAGVSTPTIRLIGSALGVVAVAGFLAAGVAVLLDAAWWTGAVVVAAAGSLLLTVGFFQPMILLGILIDLFALSIVLWEWPPVGFLAVSG